MQRMSSFMQGLRRISGSSLPSKEESPSPIDRRASSADHSSSVLNRDNTSMNSSRRMSQYILKDVLSAAESESPSLLTSPRDILPNDSSQLEGLLNYHVGQLERIKREVDMHNETIGQLTYTYYDMRQHSHLVHAAGCLYARIQGLRNARNRLAKFVLFHLRELERIDEAKGSLEKHRRASNM
ncbi:hypothetical protein PRK78_000420 [Emydomyces testavorans]|uniref:Uncharacterized protein n=1 Tax=Emydomyces testavorans TaxID=2070801 RepID=A0AAF0DB23_9EURO|nr:hypothetical protein PRK78_000420 [Emydomyces testavorans]